LSRKKENSTTGVSDAIEVFSIEAEPSDVVEVDAWEAEDSGALKADSWVVEDCDARGVAKELVGAAPKDTDDPGGVALFNVAWIKTLANGFGTLVTRAAKGIWDGEANGLGIADPELAAANGEAELDFWPSTERLENGFDKMGINVDGAKAAERGATDDTNGVVGPLPSLKGLGGLTWDVTEEAGDARVEGLTVACDFWFGGKSEFGLCLLLDFVLSLPSSAASSADRFAVHDLSSASAPSLVVEGGAVGLRAFKKW
jgi:hypothetical protein